MRNEQLSPAEKKAAGFIANVLVPVLMVGAIWLLIKVQSPEEEET